MDDTNGGGPETITIPNYQDADMHYSILQPPQQSWDVDGVEDVQVQGCLLAIHWVEAAGPDLSENPSG
ncbi:hypothetical protein O9993_21620 [Vibrio lentus]|nr:hypothetical protein [Vibrio lentus]